MIKSIKYFVVILLLAANIIAQKIDRPKLVVGIVVDQMRYDYLVKYYDDFGEFGFKRLMNDGANFTNCKINYIPSVTAAGHASIYTGTTPFYHGIVANDWKNRKTLEDVNACTAITKPETKIGKGISNDESPENLISTTIGDQLRLSNFDKSKVFSISIKNRGALMPAGKGASAAFWFNDDTGDFVSSFYYMSHLPDWLINFNNSGLVDSYIKKEWDLYKHENVYSDLPPDNSPYETDVFNEGRTSFPHNLSNVSDKEKYSKFTHTPWGNQILVDLAKEVIKNEKLGKNKYTDMLAISFSSPDKIGHDYGIQSYEVKDTYLRLDKQITELLNYLDQKVGENNYLLFLTADHGAMPNTTHLKDMNFDAGVLENTDYLKQLKNFLITEYGNDKIIKTRFSRNLYLNYELIDSLKLNPYQIEKSIKEFLLFNVPEIAEVYTRTELEKMTASRESSNLVLNGFNKKRSGDILYSLKANYLNWEKKYGAQHGSGHTYDTHIPLLFYGKNIPHKTCNKPVFIVDIAATVADLLEIDCPSDCIGIPLFAK